MARLGRSGSAVELAAKKNPRADRAPADLGTQISRSLARVKDERTRIVLQMAIAKLDTEAVQKLQDELDALPDDGAVKLPRKQLRIPRQLATAAPWIANLDLDRSEPLQVLGIGRPLTHFLQCAKALGHSVTALCPSNFVNERLLALYDIAHLPNQKLRELPNAHFDVIAAGDLSFSGEAEWASFVRPLSRRLAENGRLFFTLSTRGGANALSPEAEAAYALFEKLGAQVFRDDASIVLTKKAARALARNKVAAGSASAEATEDAISEQVLTQPAESAGRAAGRRKAPARKGRTKRLRLAMWSLVATGAVAAAASVGALLLMVR